MAFFFVPTSNIFRKNFTHRKYNISRVQKILCTKKIPLKNYSKISLKIFFNLKDVGTFFSNGDNFKTEKTLF